MTFFNQNGMLSANTGTKIYYEKLMYYKLFEFK